MTPTTGRNQQLGEEMIDATLADSFPASDPPSGPWAATATSKKKLPVPQPRKRQKYLTRRSLL
jgi:hypothetical protein